MTTTIKIFKFRQTLGEDLSIAFTINVADIKKHTSSVKNNLCMDTNILIVFFYFMKDTQKKNIPHA